MELSTGTRSQATMLLAAATPATPAASTDELTPNARSQPFLKQKSPTVPISVLMYMPVRETQVARLPFPGLKNSIE